MTTVKCAICDGTGQNESTGRLDVIRSFIRCGVCEGKGFVDVINTIKMDCPAWDAPIYASDSSLQPEEIKRLMEPGDIDLTVRALHACGYRTHIKERAGTRWVTAVKGLDVRYEHWHPLTNITQAMQLLIDAPSHGISLTVWGNGLGQGFVGTARERVRTTDPQQLIAAQCRAIVTACASLEVVR